MSDRGHEHQDARAEIAIGLRESEAQERQELLDAAGLLIHHVQGNRLTHSEGERVIAAVELLRRIYENEDRTVPIPGITLRHVKKQHDQGKPARIQSSTGGCITVPPCTNTCYYCAAAEDLHYPDPADPGRYCSCGQRYHLSIHNGEQVRECPTRR
jgi:hypothetical protein